MQFDFGDVLARAGRIIWRFKVLWIFGILASCGRGGGGSVNFNSGGGGGGGGGGNYNGQLPEFLRFLEDIPPENIAIAIVLFAFAMVCLGIVLAVVTFFIRMVGRLGLIQGTLFAEAGAERLSFMQLFNAGKPYYWRIFFLNLLIGIAGAVVTLFIGLPIMFVVMVFILFTFGLGLLCLLPLFLLLMLVSLVIQVIVEQANIALVVDDLDIFSALQKGWEVVSNNWGVALVMGLVLFFVQLIVGFLIAIPAILALGPSIAGMMGGVIGENLNLILGGFAVTILCFCALFPFLLVIGGMLESYVKSAWTLTYMRLTDHVPSLPELEAGAA